MVVAGIKLVSRREETQQEQPFIDLIRYWVKSWFFDVETESEDKYSKKLFKSCWRKMQKESGNLSPAVIAVAEKLLQNRSTCRTNTEPITTDYLWVVLNAGQRPLSSRCTDA
jgi:hypothetical protein